MLGSRLSLSGAGAEIEGGSGSIQGTKLEKKNIFCCHVSISKMLKFRVIKVFYVTHSFGLGELKSIVIFKDFLNHF